ncbi:GyrI-like domain-containing protein [Pseudonocardia sp. GCM10023141]|uniref:GyrI-like domain-containing protein n=1 Tax=Pseudonocardia sp. GCM10023141 TaxID=3252653 RepID=UPI00362311D0
MDGDMGYVIHSAVADAQPTAVLAAATTWPEFGGLWKALLDEVHREVHWFGDGRTGRNVMLYLDNQPHVEVGVLLEHPARLDGRVTRSELPGGRVATTVHRGPYETVGAAHDAVLQWAAAHDERLPGPRWEIYGHWYSDPALLETEVTYLLCPDPDVQ